MLNKTDLLNIQIAIQALKKGGIIALPTDTVYGIAADAGMEAAIEKINLLKKRPMDKNYILQVGSINDAEKLCREWTPQIKKTVKKYWPGQITFIFNKNPEVSYPFLDETIAIRIPDHELCLTLLKLYDKPLVVTSLNMSGEPEILRVADIPEQIGEQLDYVLPEQGVFSQKASTIVDLTRSYARVLRQGNVIFEAN
ncbi:MAG: L-threonylcarbamoyladenylate synthase [Candidatus Margulisbacteria bacterium]|nr:L-threonylcarbamoyladenylate synthase [Candidatus Margulisiibacteriota bacterium]